jgi:Zn-dependent protease
MVRAMSIETQAVKGEQGISVIFWLLVAVFALTGASLASGDLGGVGVFAFVFLGWIISLCLHEWGHAATAWAGGDQSVEERGYLTLNPLKYANPMLSIVLPLVFLAMGGIGFPGGAVYVNTGRLRGPLWRMGVSAAGPAMNLACLIAIGFVFSAIDKYDEPGPFVAALGFLAFLQATAFLLNLLPVPGLDGFGILQAILPDDARGALARVSGITLILFLGVMIAAPQLLAPLWAGALALCEMVGINRESIVNGLDLFRFWEAPASPFAR